MGNLADRAPYLVCEFIVTPLLEGETIYPMSDHFAEAARKMADALDQMVQAFLAVERAERVRIAREIGPLPVWEAISLLAVYAERAWWHPRVWKLWLRSQIDMC